VFSKRQVVFEMRAQRRVGWWKTQTNSKTKPLLCLKMREKRVAL